MHPFYGKEIDPVSEQEVIKKILSKYRQRPVSADLKKTIYEELAAAKAAGTITIPFKVVMRKSRASHSRDYIEVVLDTKV